MNNDNIDNILNAAGIEDGAEIENVIIPETEADRIIDISTPAETNMPGETEAGPEFVESDAEPAAERTETPENDAAPVEPQEESTVEENMAEESGNAAAETETQEKAKKNRKKDRKKQAAKAEDKPKGKGRAKLGLILGAVILAGIFAGITYAGYRATETQVINKNIYIGDVNIGGMTEEEAYAAVIDSGWEESVRKSLTINALDGKVASELDYFQAGAQITAREAVSNAFEYGHTANWYSNLYSYVYGNFNARRADINESNLNMDYIDEKLAEFAKDFNEYMSDSDYVLDYESATISFHKGSGQITADLNVLRDIAVAGFEGDNTDTVYDISKLRTSAPDFKTLSEELNVEVHNAEFDLETYEILPDTKGYILDPEKAGEIWNATANGEYAVIPIEVNEPEVTTEYLTSLMYRDLLGTTTTYFSGSTSERINNIGLAVSKINGTILFPGDVFSYNGTVGQRTKEAGFQLAGAYQDGQVVQELGGGICQVSSTLYATTMRAQMETVERTCHQFRVDYLDPGYDATVSWPDVDFKFKNCRDFPIKIVAYTSEKERSVTIEIWGTNLDGTYCELSYGVGYVYDSEYPDVLIAKSAVCYRTIYDKDGNEIESFIEDYSLYNLHDSEINWPPEKYASESGGGGNHSGYSEEEHGSGINPGSEETGGEETGGGETGGGETGGGETGGGDSGIVPVD